MMKYFHAHYADILLRRLSQPMWSLINYAAARWWGVRIGRRCHFIGKAYFNTLPGSSVNIGACCTFNSNHTSNQIGVYSPCMVSTISRKARISIGSRCGFSGTVIASALSVTLGDRVRCGANTLITDTDWHPDDPRSGQDAPIVIEDDVWLGYGVKVLKGVHIGKGSLIGAGSIVTHDIPAGVIAAGTPCKVLKPIDLPA